MTNHQGRNASVRVVLADDNEAMREAVADLLAPRFDLIRTLADGRALVAAAAELKPDVAVVDISMPIMNGIEAATEIEKLGLGVKIVFLTVNEDRDFVQAAFDAGASSYVIKRKMASDLLPALAAAIAGRTFVST